MYKTEASLLLTAVVLLAGCATMSEKECKTADWRQLGFADGGAGLAQTNFESRRSACADHGISANLDAYRIGHMQGVPLYCTRENGFEEGKRGASYQGVCPPQLAGAFQRGYEKGAVIYQAQQRLNARQNDLNQMARERSEVKDELKRARDRAVSDTLSEKERRQAVRDVEALSVELDRRDQQIAAFQRQLDDESAHWSRLNAAPLLPE